MSSRARPAYDPWRDASGLHIPVGAQVEQIAVAKEHGALSSRLHQQGDVVDRRGTRLILRFGAEEKPVSIRPHLVRVLAQVKTPRPDHPQHVNVPDGEWRIV